MARPAAGFDASRYFRSDVDLAFYNVGTGRTRAVAREIYRANRDRWALGDAITFADSLITDHHFEVKAIGIEAIACYRAQFTPPLLAVCKRWLARNYSANWATTDSICGSLIGPLLVQHPHLAERMRAWSRDRSMWVRRASIVSLIPLVRDGSALDVAYDIAKSLHTDGEDLIQKAVGWTLREAGKVDANRLERYLRANGPMIPRTTLRYAIERCPEPKRRALLAATKS